MYAVRFPWLAPCALWMVACSSASPAPRPSPSPAVVTARPLAEAPPSVESPTGAATGPRAPVDIGSSTLPAWTPPPGSADSAACKAISRAQESASAKDASLPEGAVPVTFSPVPCLPGAQGAWGLVQTITRYEHDSLNAMLDPGCGQPDDNPCLYNASLSIVPTYVDRAGAAHTGKALLEDTSGNRGPAEAPSGAFDLDGDGAPELLFAFGGSSILTFKDGAVTPYAAAKGLVFEELVDVDEDGRPDLLLANPYIANLDVLGCGKRGGAPVLGFQADVRVVARSSPNGTFSTDDPAAQAVSKRACPVKPDPIVVKDAQGKYDNAAIRQNVACARVWGVSAQAVIGALDAGCKWPAANDECEALFDIRDGTPIATCAGREQLVSWAKAPAPITLR